MGDGKEVLLKISQHLSKTTPEELAANDLRHDRAQRLYLIARWVDETLNELLNDDNVAPFLEGRQADGTWASVVGATAADSWSVGPCLKSVYFTLEYSWWRFQREDRKTNFKAKWHPGKIEIDFKTFRYFHLSDDKHVLNDTIIAEFKFEFCELLAEHLLFRRMQATELANTRKEKSIFGWFFGNKT
jgi:hypothetical protein